MLHLVILELRIHHSPKLLKPHGTMDLHLLAVILGNLFQALRYQPRMQMEKQKLIPGVRNQHLLLMVILIHGVTKQHLQLLIYGTTALHKRKAPATMPGVNKPEVVDWMLVAALGVEEQSTRIVKRVATGVRHASRWTRQLVVIQILGAVRSKK